MGERGPVPKRTAERRRRNKSDVEVVEVPAVEVPPDAPVWVADEGWHPVATAWFESLQRSAQRQFYQESDWATAYLLAESLSRDLEPQFVGFAQTGRDQTAAEFAKIPLKGSSLSAYLKGMTDLLTTEGARRRARIEIEATGEPKPSASVTAIATYRDQLLG